MLTVNGLRICSRNISCYCIEDQFGKRKEVTDSWYWICRILLCKRSLPLLLHSVQYDWQLY